MGDGERVGRAPVTKPRAAAASAAAAAAQEEHETMEEQTRSVGRSVGVNPEGSGRRETRIRLSASLRRATGRRLDRESRDKRRGIVERSELKQSARNAAAAAAIFSCADATATETHLLRARNDGKHQSLVGFILFNNDSTTPMYLCSVCPSVGLSTCISFRPTSTLQSSRPVSKTRNRAMPHIRKLKMF